VDASSFTLLEYDLIKALVREYCVSNLGKALCDRLAPSTDLQRVKVMLQETTEGRLIAATGAQPIQGLHDVSEPLALVHKGQVLAPGDLLRIADTMRGALKLKKLMRGKKTETPLLSSYAETIAEVPGLVNAIETSVDGERVSDNASDDLRRVRRTIRQIESKIQDRLQAIMGSASLKDAVQEGFVTQKNGRYVIPVKASHKARIPGTVVAASSSGQTVFIEPSSVQPLVNNLVTLRAQEEDLVYKVLCELSTMVLENLPGIKVTVEALAACDFALAKGRYSLDVRGVEPRMGAGSTLRLRGVRHPLLDRSAVPVDVEVGGAYRTLLITGPNTGGKTVLLKTVGLACLMAQSGLHVPAEEAVLPLFGEILADIGDRQSIQQSLSTFSSHMANIAGMLGKAGHGSLVLLDEIGTGTDPREGAALACSILEHLYSLGCVTVATSHYGDVKSFVESRKGFMTGCVEFDEETLQPLYRLQIGKSGKSQGIVVAERLGIPASVILRSRQMAGQAPGQTPEQAPGQMLGPALAQGEVQAQVAEPAPRGPGAAAPRAPHADPALPRERQFLLGDLVYVGTVQDKGRVAQEADEQGNLIVLVRGRRVKVNRKRLKLLGKREDLYPDLPNYDLRIVLTSKEDRKLDKAMSKRPVDAVRVIPRDPE